MRELVPHNQFIGFMRYVRAVRKGEPTVDQWPQLDQHSQRELAVARNLEHKVSIA